MDRREIRELATERTLGKSAVCSTPETHADPDRRTGRRSPAPSAGVAADTKAVMVLASREPCMMVPGSVSESIGGVAPQGKSLTRCRREQRCLFAALLASLIFAVACGDSLAGNPTAPSPVGSPSPPATVSSQGGAGLALNPMSRSQEGRPRQGIVTFPPRNEPNAFFNALQTLYRDTLRREQIGSFVDSEGVNVWLTEYFRFYLNGCSHQEAISRTLAEIRSGGSQNVCGSETPSFPPRNLPNDFYNRLVRVYRDELRRTEVPTYVDGEGANVWLAQYLRFRLSSCSHSIAQGKVFTEIRGGGVQSDCTPTTPPPPAPVSQFHVWGGSNYTQYLGFFSCVFCREFDTNSINNEFGRYGSRFSPTSIRNQFSQYGSRFSTYSTCNKFASSPPRVFDRSRAIYYGELTLNQFRSEAIRIDIVVDWLTRDVCT